MRLGFKKFRLLAPRSQGLSVEFLVIVHSTTHFSKILPLRLLVILRKTLNSPILWNCFDLIKTFEGFGFRGWYTTRNKVLVYIIAYL